MCNVLLQLEDTLWSSLTDSYIKTPMALTAENLAEKYGITRQECDELALQSQQRWAAGGGGGGGGERGGATFGCV